MIQMHTQQGELLTVKTMELSRIKGYAFDVILESGGEVRTDVRCNIYEEGMVAIVNHLLWQLGFTEKISVKEETIVQKVRTIA